MAKFLENPLSFHLIAGCLCKFLKKNEVQTMSLLARDWKTVTDNIIGTDCEIKINKENINNLNLLSRRYVKFFLEGISSEDLNIFLLFIIKRYSQDSSNGKYKRYLKQLTMKDVQLSDSSLRLLKELEFIEKLFFSTCNMDFPYSENMNLSLNELLFTVKSANENELCKNFLSSNKQSLKRIYVTNPEDILPVDSVHYPHLEHIIFNSTLVNFEEFFKKNPQLKKCEFYCMKIPLGTIRMLQKYCPKLDELYLRCCRTREECENFNAECAQKLKVLLINGTLNFNLPGTKFEKLNTFVNNSRTPEYLMSIFPTMPELLNLTLSRSHRHVHGYEFSSELLKVISESCPKLEKLDLRKIIDINKNCELYEFKTFERLVHFQCHNTKFNDQLLFSLSMPRLLVVNLKDTCITDKALEYLADNCPLLEEATLGQNSDITDEGVSYMVEKLKNLTFLDLEKCSKITLTTFHTVLAKKMINANLAGGVRMTMEDIRKTKNTIKNIKDDMVLIKDYFRSILVSVL